jgi:hypothetical protein
MAEGPGRTLRIRRAITQSLHAVDHAAAHWRGRRQVLLYSRIPAHFMAVRPVIEALREDPRVDVSVCSAEGRADTIAAFGESGLADRLLARQQCTWRRFDLYIDGDPWVLADLHRCARRINFFHGVAGKYGLDAPPFDAHLFDWYDRVAFVNRDRMRRYLAARIVKPRQAVLVGFPKLDRLVTDPPDGDMVRRDLGLIPGRLTIMYAPTWSYASSLHIAGEAIIETLLGIGANVIAKLHDNCFERGERFAAGVDWRERLWKFNGRPGFHLATSADSTLYVAASDIIVTDHSSIGFEACAVDRPVIVFDAPDLPRVARINPEKMALLRSASDVVYSVAELPQAVAEALRNPTRRASARRRVAAEMFHDPGRATARALDVIYELLELPAPERAGATRLALPAESRQSAVRNGVNPQSAIRNPQF